MIRGLLVCLLCTCSVLYSHGTSYPYLSEDTWYTFCDWKLSPKEGFDPTKVKLGDTVMIEDIDCKIWETLKVFQTEYLPKISEPFILITPRSDYSLPGNFDYLLSSEKIVAWFVQNIDRAPTDKLFPMPIGLTGRRWGYDPVHIDHANEKRALEPNSRGQFVYVNFEMTHPNRDSCFKHLRTLKKVTFASRKSLEGYLKDLSQSVFVASPRGNGLDCHRTWEALLLGCYPIVKHSSLDPLFEDLPVVLIHDWKEVTEEFLEEKRKSFDGKTWATEKLYASYWFEKIRSIQKKIRETTTRSAS